jgi:hypothetical protein
VYCWYSESQQYGEKSIMYRTYNDFSQLLQDHTPTKFLPGILATASECVKVSRITLLESKLKDKIRLYMLKLKGKAKIP